jgi:hypothetical protein
MVMYFNMSELYLIETNPASEIRLTDNILRLVTTVTICVKCKKITEFMEKPERFILSLN